LIKRYQNGSIGPYLGEFFDSEYVTNPEERIEHNPVYKGCNRGTTSIVSRYSMQWSKNTGNWEIVWNNHNIDWKTDKNSG
jgi:hypothetical protein